MGQQLTRFFLLIFFAKKKEKYIRHGQLFGKGDYSRRSRCRGGDGLSYFARLDSIPFETTRPATSISTVDTQNRQVRLIKQSHNVSTKKPTLGATETAAATTTVKRAKMLLAHNVPWRFESTLHWRPVL